MKNGNQDRFCILFGEAIQRKKRNETTFYDSECSFRPMISENSRVLTARNQGHYMIMKKEPSQGPKHSFKPTISRGPKKDRKQVPIWDYLHSEGISHRHPQKQKNLNINKSAANLNKSDILVDHLRKNSFQEIFELLDSDKDGQITYEKYDISSIS